MVEDVIKQLGVPNTTPDILRELYIITGKDFSRDHRGNLPNETLLTVVKRWWSSQPEGRFTSGKLYKYGCEQELTTVF